MIESGSRNALSPNCVNNLKKPHDSLMLQEMQDIKTGIHAGGETGTAPSQGRNHGTYAKRILMK